MVNLRALLTAVLSLVIGVTGSRVFTSTMFPAVAGSVPNVSVQSNGDQRFWNWDFYGTRSKSGQLHCPNGPLLNSNGRPSVETPISFVFTGYATVEKIRKYLLWRYYRQVGSDGCMMFTTKSGRHIASMSKGFKTDECSFDSTEPRTTDEHIRLYGPVNERDPRYRLLYSKRWGHWVLGAVHYDEGDCHVFFQNPDTHYPSTPDVVNAFVERFRHNAGCIAGAINIHNKWRGGAASHQIISDGWAVHVVIPKHFASGAC